MGGFISLGVRESLDRGQHTGQERLALGQGLGGGKAAPRPWEGETETDPYRDLTQGGRGGGGNWVWRNEGPLLTGWTGAWPCLTFLL